MLKIILKMLKTNTNIDENNFYTFVTNQFSFLDNDSINPQRLENFGSFIGEFLKIFLFFIVNMFTKRHYHLLVMDMNFYTKFHHQNIAKFSKFFMKSIKLIIFAKSYRNQHIKIILILDLRMKFKLYQLWITQMLSKFIIILKIM